MGLDMNNLVIKSLLILMFVLIMSQNSESAYSPLIIILGVGMISTLVVQYIKEGGTTSDEVVTLDEEE